MLGVVEKSQNNERIRKNYLSFFAEGHFNILKQKWMKTLSLY